MILGFLILGGVSFVIGFAFYKASPLPKPSGDIIEFGVLAA